MTLQFNEETVGLTSSIRSNHLEDFLPTIKKGDGSGSDSEERSGSLKSNTSNKSKRTTRTSNEKIPLCSTAVAVGDNTDKLLGSGPQESSVPILDQLLNNNKNDDANNTGNKDNDNDGTGRGGGNELKDLPNDEQEADFRFRPRKSTAASTTTATYSQSHSSTGGGSSKGKIKRKVMSMLRGSTNNEHIKDIWTRDDDDQWGCQSAITTDDDEEGHKFHFRKWIINSGHWWYDTLKTALTSPSILIPCLILFAAICTCGILVVKGVNSAATTSRKDTAISMAAETDIFFSRVLERAFVPLFTMAQFVRELPEFHDMPFEVGNRCDPNAIDITTGTNTDCSLSVAAPILDGKPTHRNLTGVFPPGLQEKFAKIASGIKEKSGLGKALVNIQLAPKAVVSMLYPIVNCDDFEEGICLDNTGAIGHDLLNDPKRVGIARATVPANGVVTAGPLSLIQGNVPVVKDSFIARLPINMPGHSIVVDGVDYPCWGFAVILLNWATLKDESDIYNNFARSGMQFKLTRTDVKIDPSTGSEKVKVVKIAESLESYLIANENVTLNLKTGDNDWEISVGYDDGFSPHYERWGYPIVFSGGFVFTILLMLVLVSKKQHERLLHRMMPQRAIKKLRRGKTVVETYSMATIFFSDIVGYTTMSSEMTPMEVMTMLNQLFTKFDKLCEKHDIFKLETIGDAFIAVGGAPKKCSGAQGAEKVALFALDALKTVEDFRTPSGAKLYIRAGLASGPVVAGVVGTSLPKYTLFGDTVNFASRMESTSENMRLQVSPITHRLLLDAPKHNFAFEQRKDKNGELGIDVKGKGRQFTWWVNSASEIPEKKEGVAVEIPVAPTKQPQTADCLENDDVEANNVVS